MSLAYFSTTTISGHPLDNLTVITGVIGRASLFGGRGSMLGTFIGVFVPEMLAAGLIIIGVNQYWQYIFTGLVLGAAVYLDQLRRRLREPPEATKRRLRRRVSHIQRSKCHVGIPRWSPAWPRSRPSAWG